jgi:putative aldouronate transport system substrate-binding protein
MEEKMKKRILVTMLVLAAVVAAFVGCSKNAVPVQSSTTATTTTTTTTTAAATPAVEEKKVEPLTYAPGTVLRTATGYNSKKTGLSFDADTAGQGITLAGVTYHTGDLKPTWVEVENKLGIKIEDKYQGNSATNEFKYWQERLNEVDLVSGNTVALNEYGAKGSLVNIAEYLDRMPNFKAYLEANPIVRLSITGDTTTGAIYFAPYFDGVNDIERMPLMRVDWVEKLLDGEGSFSAAKSGNLKAAQYEPYMPTSGKVSIETPTADGKSVMTLTKDYDKAGNIVKTMNDALAKGTVTGVQAVNMLRDYIDKAYNGYYGTKRSNLFIGQDAAWDADELVALLRCVVANAYTLNGTDSIQGLFSREDSNLQRQVDLFRFAGHLFGVRGLESRQDYLYVDTDGKLKDARQEVATYEAMERMHDLVLEGLISESFVKSQGESSSTMLENNLGFMSYDYNQTQTILNETKLKNIPGAKYMAVMVPVARWYDGTDPNGVYMRFTESWRSVKTDAWAISKEGVGNDTDKLNAALALFDFAFSPEGQILLSYGPDAFIKHKADGSYETFLFNGQEMPVIADETYELLWSLAKGNYTNFARYYLGSTLSFAKSQAFEYQCTIDVGKEGAGHISTAIGLGTVKHPELAIAANKWYTSVPTVLPGSTVESDAINSYTELIQQYQNAKGKFSVLVDQIQNGYTTVGVKDAASAAEKAKGEWSGAQYLQIRERQWERLVKFYESL